MKEFPVRQMFLLALATSPLISAITVSPALIVSGAALSSILLVIFVVSFFIFFAWMLHILILRFIKKDWPLRWYRIFLVSAIIIAIGFLLTNIIKPENFIHIKHFGLMRIINIFCVNTIIFIIADLILVRHRERILDRENVQLKLVNLESQYKLLKDQINPHFLFNALSTVKALIRQEPEMAEKYIVSLGEFLRSNIKNDRALVTLREELLECENYLQLQKIRFQDGLSVKCDLPEEHMEQHLPSFTLITLAENAIKHNAFTNQHPLNIVIHYNEGCLFFKNNITPKKLPEASSKTGLANLRERYKLLMGYDISIMQDEREFCVKLKMQEHAHHSY